MRPSNTTPVIVLRFEADSHAALQRIQEDFRKVLLGADNSLVLPF
jgi:phosphomannomutase/phosphoglucomutase